MTETMPAAQIQAGKELVAYLKKKYGISKVQRHSDVCATSCPGKNFKFSEMANGTSYTPPTTSTTPSAPKPSTSTTTSGKISEDGIWGQATTKKLQQVLGTAADGVVSNQSQADFNKCNKGGLLTSTFKFGKGGSPCIKALQKKIGSTADGYMGVNTIKALQKYLGTTVDGYVSSPSPMVKALQKRLNSGKL